MFKQISRLSVGILGGGLAYYSIENIKSNVVSASWTTGYTFNADKWDNNWDQRAPEVSANSKSKDSGDNNGVKSKACRNIILIRHGQYNVDGQTDKERSLTDLGKLQAKLTGARLKELGFPYSQIVRSTMTRALETGEIIHQMLHNVPDNTCPLLEEGAPVPPDPPIGHWKPPKYQFFQDGARIEAAFRKYFHRADVEQTKDSYDIIVCHANVIRYFVLRALQYPAEGWLRLSLNHASITWLQILPSGRVILRCYGDSGFMPPNAISSS